MTGTKVRPAADTTPAADARRVERLRQRSWLWAHSSNDSCRGCGRTATAPVVAVAVNAAGRAAVQGLRSCGRAAFCPWCAVKIGEHRRSELVRAFAAWRDLGTVTKSRWRSCFHGCGDTVAGVCPRCGWSRHTGDDCPEAECDGTHRVVMVTLTIQHHRGTSLAALWDDLALAWRRTQAGRAWRAIRAQAGVAHYVRVTEVTHGDNGWHPHLHVALLVHGDQWDPRDEDRVDRAAARLRSDLIGRWQTKVEDLGRVAAGAAQDVKVFGGDPTQAAAEYFSKAAFELGRADLKDGKNGGRTWWAVLAGAVDGVAEDVALWAEWERVALGRRFIGYSRGLRDALLAGVEERSDEDVAQDTLDGEALVVLDAPAFLRAVRDRWSGGRRWAQLLDAAEDGHRRAGRLGAVMAIHRWADLYGVPLSGETAGGS